MRYLFLLISASIFIFSCEKDERITYRMSGIYILSKIEQTQTLNGNTTETTFEDPGFLYLRYDGYHEATFNPGVLNVNEETEPNLYCLDEIGEETIFDWAMIGEELVWERSYNEFGWPVSDSCFFEIKKDKKFKKEIRYTDQRTDADGNTLEIEEIFYMKLKED